MANETRNLAATAINLIDEYPIADNKNLILVKAGAREMLFAAILKANQYYTSSAGYNAGERRNDKLADHAFIRPAYEGIKHFIQAVDGGMMF